MQNDALVHEGSLNFLIYCDNYLIFMDVSPTLRELRRRQYSMDIPEREHMSTEKQRPIPKPR